MIAWDNHGRAFFGSESSDDPAGTPKTFGDVFVARFRNPDGTDAADHDTKDGLEYYGTTVVAKGSSAPNLLGKFNDKTAIEADRTGTPVVTATSTSRGRASPATAAWASTSPARPTTA